MTAEGIGLLEHAVHDRTEQARQVGNAIAEVRAREAHAVLSSAAPDPAIERKVVAVFRGNDLSADRRAGGALIEHLGRVVGSRNACLCMMREGALGPADHAQSKTGWLKRELLGLFGADYRALLAAAWPSSMPVARREVFVGTPKVI